MAIDLRKSDNGGVDAFSDASSESELKPVRTVYPENYGAPEIYPAKRAFKVFPEKNGTEISPVPEKDVNSISAGYAVNGSVSKKPKKYISRNSIFKIIGIISLLMIMAALETANKGGNRYNSDLSPEDEILLAEASNRSVQISNMFLTSKTETIYVANRNADVYFIPSDEIGRIYITAEVRASASYSAELKDGTVCVSLKNGSADDVIMIYIPENYGRMIEVRNTKKCRSNIYCKAGKDFWIEKAGTGGIYFDGIDAKRAYIFSDNSFVQINDSSFAYKFEVIADEVMIRSCDAEDDVYIKATNTISLSDLSVHRSADFDTLSLGGIKGDNIRLYGKSSFNSMLGDIHLESADLRDTDIYTENGNIYVSAVKGISEYLVKTDTLYGDCNINDTTHGNYSLNAGTKKGNIELEFNKKIEN